MACACGRLLRVPVYAARESADKPGSVGSSRHPRQSFISTRGCPRALATYPQARWATSSLAYLVLLRVEVAAFHPAASGALASTGCNGLVSVPFLGCG